MPVNPPGFCFVPVPLLRHNLKKYSPTTDPATNRREMPFIAGFSGRRRRERGTRPKGFGVLPLTGQEQMGREAVLAPFPPASLVVHQGPEQNRRPPSPAKKTSARRAFLLSPEEYPMAAAMSPEQGFFSQLGGGGFFSDNFRIFVCPAQSPGLAAASPMPFRSLQLGVLINTRGAGERLKGLQGAVLLPERPPHDSWDCCAASSPRQDSRELLLLRAPPRRVSKRCCEQSTHLRLL
ncbi:hypothetical protein CRENBAI_025498 [Crenichthys baileyi]|uniref:Uncharacterized protein n=1 Tax=Crenichthys baileyi TaxID=28760 RepID=A0AAV9S993_9TELE